MLAHGTPNGHAHLHGRALGPMENLGTKMLPIKMEMAPFNPHKINLMKIHKISNNYLR
jgi:hypothetical protein